MHVNISLRLQAILAMAALSDMTFASAAPINVALAEAPCATPPLQRRDDDPFENKGEQGAGMAGIGIGIASGIGAAFLLTTYIFVKRWRKGYKEHMKHNGSANKQAPRPPASGIAMRPPVRSVPDPISGAAATGAVPSPVPGASAVPTATRPSALKAERKSDGVPQMDIALRGCHTGVAA
ncbi:hypothetical protein MKZ38_001834 [Zalerion maritima]|uniref:Uncharacterized protein n=1 Tax=Zalerion maritima TaxID=339359 RepID=A0AAD5RPS4_9PEZI|nr:hypothetical protein MKZ38_001834 [Zalerion maritima]